MAGANTLPGVILTRPLPWVCRGDFGQAMFSPLTPEKILTALFLRSAEECSANVLP